MADWQYRTLENFNPNFTIFCFHAKGGKYPTTAQAKSQIAKDHKLRKEKITVEGESYRSVYGCETDIYEKKKPELVRMKCVALNLSKALEE